MYYYHGLTPYLVKKKSGENWVTHQTYTLAPGALGHIMHVRTIDGSTEDRYYHYDRLGNVMNVTDENGLALVNYVQEGFGNVLLTQEDFARLEMHSPIAAYDFPEGSGSTTDDRTSNNYDGTISGASWTTGEFTYGLSFDGSDDKVSFSTHPSTSGSFSVAAWVKIDSTSGFHPVVTNFTPGMDIELKGWRLGVNNGKVCLQLWDQWEEPYEALGTTTLSTSKWYLIAATYDSSSDAMKVYVNGTDDTSGSPTGDYTTGDNFGIGWDGVSHPATEYYDGLIDSVAVYNTKLSSTQVQQLWDSGDKSGYHLTTKEYDPDAGLYYFWQRWYDPMIGKFVQKDSYESPHNYNYADSNPLVCIDSTGLLAYYKDYTGPCPKTYDAEAARCHVYCVNKLGGNYQSDHFECTWKRAIKVIIIIVPLPDPPYFKIVRIPSRPNLSGVPVRKCYCVSKCDWQRGIGPALKSKKKGWKIPGDPRPKDPYVF